MPRIQDRSESSYSVAVTPFKYSVFSIPISTFIASCLAFVAYVISGTLLLTSKCPFDATMIRLFVVLCVALVALICMLVTNAMYKRYKFNCLTLSLSLLYSASIGMLLLCLISATYEGVCKKPPEPTDKDKSDKAKSVFLSSISEIAAWLLAALGVLFQIVTHYFFG